MSEGLTGDTTFWMAAIFLSAIALLFLSAVMRELRHLGAELGSIRLDSFDLMGDARDNSGGPDDASAAFSQQAPEDTTAEMANMLRQLSNQINRISGSLSGLSAEQGLPPQRREFRDEQDWLEAQGSFQYNDRYPDISPPNLSPEDPAAEMPGFEEEVDEAWFDRVFRELFGQEEDMLSPAEQQRYLVFKALNWNLMQRQRFISRFTPDNN